MISIPPYGKCGTVGGLPEMKAGVSRALLPLRPHIQGCRNDEIICGSAVWLWVALSPDSG